MRNNSDDGKIETHYILVDTVRRLVAAGAPEPDLASPGLLRGRLCAFWLDGSGNPIGSVMVDPNGSVKLTVIDIKQGASAVVDDAGFLERMMP